MKTLLVLSRQPALPSAIQAVLDADKYQIIAKGEAWEADALLSRGAIDAAILEVELTDVRAIRVVEEIKKSASSCHVIIYTGAKEWEWEEDAYLLGVEHVLTKPVRGKLLNTLLERLFNEEKIQPLALAPSLQIPLRPTQSISDHVRALEALRHFSGVLTHS